MRAAFNRHLQLPQTNTKNKQENKQTNKQNENSLNVITLQDVGNLNGHAAETKLRIKVSNMSKKRGGEVIGYRHKVGHVPW